MKRNRIIRATSFCLSVLLMFMLLPLSARAAEQSDWKRVAGTPTMTFLDSMGNPIAELVDIYVGEDGLSFDDSKVSYGDIKEVDYGSVRLRFRYVDYNYYVEEEQIDPENNEIQELQAIARLDFGEESVEESYISFSRDPKSGYLIADIEFNNINPFVDENNEVTLFIQYVSDNGEESATYKSELNYVFSQRILPPSPEEKEEGDEKLEVEILFPELPQEEEEVSVRTETPYILVEECTIDDGKDVIAAGSTFDLNFVLKNTHKRMSLENIRMQVDMPDGLRLNHAGNSFYLGDMKKDGMMESSLSVSALPTVQMADQRIVLTFDYEYVDDETRRFESSKVEVTVPLRQPLKLIVDSVQVLPEYVCGEEEQFYSPYANHSHSTMYHVSLQVETELFAQERVFHLGNLSPGEGGSQIFSLLATEAGVYPVTVVYTYENEWGQEFSESTAFEINYVEAEEEKAESEEKAHITILPQDPTETGEAQRPYVVLLGLASCAFLAVIIALYNNMKKDQ